MSSNLNYTKTGDYFLPNLTLNQPRKQLNRYGRMRRNYLMEQRPVVYSTMLLNGTLYPHLWEVEQTAENRMQQLMKELLERNPAPDKEKKQMAWVQHMNSLKAQAEEMILTENSGQKRLLKNMHRTVPVDVRTPIWTEAVVGSTTTARG